MSRKRRYQLGGCRVPHANEMIPTRRHEPSPIRRPGCRRDEFLIFPDEKMGHQRTLQRSGVDQMHPPRSSPVTPLPPPAPESEPAGEDSFAVGRWFEVRPNLELVHPLRHPAGNGIHKYERHERSRSAKLVILGNLDEDSVERWPTHRPVPISAPPHRQFDINAAEQISCCGVPNLQRLLVRLIEEEQVLKGLRCDETEAVRGERRRRDARPKSLEAGNRFAGTRVPDYSRPILRDQQPVMNPRVTFMPEDVDWRDSPGANPMAQWWQLRRRRNEEGQECKRRAEAGERAEKAPARAAHGRRAERRGCGTAVCCQAGQGHETALRDDGRDG